MLFSFVILVEDSEPPVFTSEHALSADRSPVQHSPHEPFRPEFPQIMALLAQESKAFLPFATLAEYQ
jgi:hypothetical protein